LIGSGEPGLLPRLLLPRRVADAGKLERGEPVTPSFFGDRLRIELLDSEVRSTFGAIEREATRYEGPPA
jgi:hypothetical protein